MIKRSKPFAIFKTEGSDSMKITTQGNGIKIGPRLEDKIASKMSKFDKYFGDEGTLNVRIRPEGAKMVIEITMKLDGKIYRAEARDEDILTGVDKTVDKLESQIRRQKTKFLKKKKDYPGIVNYLEDDGGADFDFEDEPDDKITKRKQFALRPMTTEDAILQLEMLGHDRMLFCSSRCSVTISMYILTAIPTRYASYIRGTTAATDCLSLSTEFKGHMPANK